MKTATVRCDFDREWAATMRRLQLVAIGRSALRFAAVTLACLSIMVMGSESQWFPWPNLAAAGVLALLAWRVNR